MATFRHPHEYVDEGCRYPITSRAQLSMADYQKIGRQLAYKSMVLGGSPVDADRVACYEACMHAFADNHRWASVGKLAGIMTATQRPELIEKITAKNKSVERHTFFVINSLMRYQVRHEGLISRVLDSRIMTEGDSEKTELLLTNGGYLAFKRAVEIHTDESNKRGGKRKKGPLRWAV